MECHKFIDRFKQKNRQRCLPWGTPLRWSTAAPGSAPSRPCRNTWCTCPVASASRAAVSKKHNLSLRKSHTHNNSPLLGGKHWNSDYGDHCGDLVACTLYDFPLYLHFFLGTLHLGQQAPSSTMWSSVAQSSWAHTFRSHTIVPSCTQKWCGTQ